MKRLLSVLSVIFIVTSSISLGALASTIISRVVRHDWILTTAEITFIATEDGLVFGTFTDCNGQVHSHHRMYSDGRFYKFLFFSAFSSIDTEPYIGTTVRVMYDPSTLAQEEICYTTANRDGEPIVRYWGIEIDSYDNWLQSFIVSASVFGVSTVLLAVVLLIRNIQKKAAEKPEKA